MANDIFSASIYAMLDADGRPRYVGQTRLSLPERLRRHLSKAKDLSDTNHRCNWIRRCLAEGHTPVMHALQEVVGRQDDVNEAEHLWIYILKDVAGLKLTNGTYGGDAMGLSEETKAKISRSKKGKSTATPEQRLILSASMKGRQRPWSEEERRTTLVAAWEKRRQRYGPSGRATGVTNGGQ